MAQHLKFFLIIGEGLTQTHKVLSYQCVTITSKSSLTVNKEHIFNCLIISSTVYAYIKASHINKSNRGGTRKRL